MTQTKRCRTCGEEKAIELFSRQTSSIDGRQCDCKECRLQYDRLWYFNNAKRVADKRRRALRERRAKWAAIAAEAART